MREVTLTTSPDLRRQLRALLLPDRILKSWGVVTGTPVQLSVGEHTSVVWLHLDEEAPRRGQVVARLDYRTAIDLGVTPGELRTGSVTINKVNLTVQPMRLEYPQAANRAVISSRVSTKLRSRDHRVLVRSATRCMVVTAVPPPGKNTQSDDRIRLNFHARLLLGLVETEGANATVQVSSLPHGSGAGRAGSRARAIWSRFATALGAPLRWILGAPVISLAVRSSASPDDGQRVARCSASTFDVLGAEPGDRVRVRWGRRQATVRLFEDPHTDPELTKGPLIVDWSTGRTHDTLPDDSVVLIPAAVRAELGLPRDGVVDIRRSTLWVLRKRAVALTIPLVGVVLAVAGLDVPPWAATILLIVVVFMTIARDRIPRVHTKARLHD